MKTNRLGFTLALAAGTWLVITTPAPAESSSVYLPLAFGPRIGGAIRTAMPWTTPTPVAGTRTPDITPSPSSTATATDAAAPSETPTFTDTAPPPATPTPTVAATSASGAVLIHLGDPITVEGTGASVAGSTVTISAGGTYRVVGTLTDGMVDVNTTEKVELILDGVAITHATGPAIKVSNARKVTVVLADGTSNTLVDGATYTDVSSKAALFSNDTLVITGGGALTVTGRHQHGIASDDDVIVESGNLTISSATDGIHANNNITVRSGSITVTRANDGLESEGDLLIEGGTFDLAVLDDGIVSADTLTINGGTIDITSGVEGIESKHNIVVNDGLIAIAVSDDGLNATNDITINGGWIYTLARADAVDSNGTININGGVTVALGGNTPEGGLDCDRCSIVFTGGIVVATGGDNSTPATTSRQRVVVLGGTTVGSVMHIVEDGTDVLTFRVAKAYQSMVFTSPALAAGKTYTVYTGGTVTGGTEFHGLYTDATYSGGSVWQTFTTTDVVTYVGVTPGQPGRPGGPGRPR